MSGKNALRFGSVIAFAIVFSLQVLADDPAPLQLTSSRVSIAGPNGTSRDGIAVDVKNVSSKPIRAYVILFQFTDARTDQKASQIVSSAVKAAGKYLEPGAVESMRPKPLPMISGSVPDNVAVSVDCVIFGDGSTWTAGNSTELPKLKERVESADRNPPKR